MKKYSKLPVAGNRWSVVMRLLCTALLLLAPLSGLHAQAVVFGSQEQPLLTLPSQPQGLSMVDGSLYFYTSEVLLKAVRQGTEIVGYMPDTDFVRYEDGINYVVRHPSTGDLYFTKLDRKGHSCLYYSYRDGKRIKTKRIKMDDIEVEHPTFSDDGRVMVFSSAERRRSYGGYDLWYSRFRDGEWGTPVNMGNRVNSPGDDVTPCIVGDYLFFSSNGREESRKHLGIYVTRLIALQVTGDTIGMIQIGRSRVQQMPQGINSAVSDCYDFVYDSRSQCSYWVNSSSGIRSYNGSLDAVTLWGYVTDNRKKPLAGVSVTAYDDDQPIAMAASRADGFYRLTLPVGGSYTVSYRLPNHFSHQYNIQTSVDRAGNLIGDMQHDLSLDSLPVGRPIQYTDLFGPDAVVELSQHGIEVLQPLVDFLTDNPGLEADLTLTSDLTTKAEFNALLTGQRLQRLEEYLRSRLPVSVQLRFHNGCSGRVGCSDATGETRLTVKLK